MQLAQIGVDHFEHQTMQSILSVSILRAKPCQKFEYQIVSKHLIWLCGSKWITHVRLGTPVLKDDPQFRSRPGHYASAPPAATLLTMKSHSARLVDVGPAKIYVEHCKIILVGMPSNQPFEDNHQPSSKVHYTYIYTYIYIHLDIDIDIDTDIDRYR